MLNPVQFQRFFFFAVNIASCAFLKTKHKKPAVVFIGSQNCSGTTAFPPASNTDPFLYGT
jgi:hypothetical protein